ncbi:SDR family NAD(P)-dependent oxidoreductase [Sphingomonas sp.]|uniref:SDR family NAD(P)-dependent oxidoreductase n=1 Tax=Sphingomonas sp. TaxID=28214 RepID=UPI0035BBDA2C
MIFASDCLAGRRILVTGASSGIGRETAIRLAQHGAQLIAMGRDEGRLAQTAAALAGDGHLVRAADLTDADATADIVQALAKEVGPLHGVFHSAGSSLVLPAKLTKNRHLDEVFGAGFRGAFGIARAAAKKGVVADGGSVVFMSSVSSLRGRQGMVAYSAAKGAVDGMVRALATELATRRIRANSIVSGAVETAMHNDFVSSVDETLVANYRDLHLLGFGQPGDVANAAIFLLSDASVWITGTSMAVDGGYTAK